MRDASFDKLADTVAPRLLALMPSSIDSVGAKKSCCDRPEQVPCSVHSWRSR